MSSVSQLFGALLGRAINTGAQGYMNANQIRNYNNALNQGLPQGQQIPQFDQNFFFGDPSQYMQGLNNAASNAQHQAEARYYHDNYNVPMGPLGAMKNVFDSVTTDDLKGRNEIKRKGEVGRKQYQGYQWLLDQQGGGQPQGQPAPSAAPPQATPAMQFGGLEADPTVSGILPTGAGQPIQGGIQQGELAPTPPEDVYLDYDMVKDAFNYGQKERDLQRKNRQTDSLVNYRKERLGQLSKQLGISERRVAAYERRAARQGQGRAASTYEIAQSMLKDGVITPKQFREWQVKFINNKAGDDGYGDENYDDLGGDSFGTDEGGGATPTDDVPLGQSFNPDEFFAGYGIE